MKRKITFIVTIIILTVSISIAHYVTKSSDLTLHKLYTLLFFVPIVLASVRFGFKGGTITALIISIIYSPQKLLSLGPQEAAINELLDVFLFVAAGIVSGILVEKKNLAVNAIDSQLNNYVILENYTNSVLESINLGIIAINNDYFITSANTAAKSILGISSDCIGLNFIDAFSCCVDMEQFIKGASEQNMPFINIERKLQKDQKEVHIKVDIFPLNTANKNKGLVIIIEDITEITKIKNQVHQNDKLASVGQLATGIAHEIRNPLAIIKMIEQTMSRELVDNESLSTELKVIDEEIERANKVITSLMEFSKPNKNEKSNYSMNRIIEDVLVITDKYTSQHKVSVHFEKSEVPEGEYDREQIIQAFINLIFNAVDAMPQGGNIFIITTKTQDNKIQILFSDTGLGIEENALNKIFDPFFTTKAEGTGLGLAILHRIIQDHEGTINVKSTPGKGTTFEIVLLCNNE